MRLTHRQRLFWGIVKNTHKRNGEEVLIKSSHIFYGLLFNFFFYLGVAHRRYSLWIRIEEDQIVAEALFFSPSLLVKRMKN